MIKDNNLDYSPEVKKGIISLLMFQLYSDERTIYREYVQNALDSINTAVDTHLLEQTKDGIVHIDIDTRSKTVKIKDNGTGISIDNAPRYLLNISGSNKDGIKQAGLYGIGRLVGGGYCHELIFRTTARGESVGTQITFDVDKIWKMVNDDEEDYLASEVIHDCTTKKIIPAEESDHYFEVILNRVKDDAAPALLNSDEIIKYLREVAPVEYKPEFKNTLIYKSTADNPEFKDLHENIDKVQVFVGEVRIQKQYGLTIKGTKDKINNLEYFKIEDSQYGMLAWGWYALTKYTIQIPKEDELAGIRLRSHNIQIGDSNQLSGTTYWREDRSNAYFYGELFVTHPQIRPNGARDGLVPTPETNALISKMKLFFENLKTLYTKANEAKKCIDKIEDGIKRINDFGGNIDYNAKDLINNKGIGKFEKMMKTTFGFDAIKRMLLLYQPDYLKAKTKAEEILKAHAPTPKNTEDTNNPYSGSDNKDPHTNFNESKTPTSDIKTPTNSNPNNSDNPTNVNNNNSIDPSTNSNLIPGITPTTPTRPIGDSIDAILPGINSNSPTTTPLLGQQDIISSLTPILDPSEIWLLRRVFKVLNSFCPDNEHDQKLIAEMERLIVKEFKDAIN